MAIRAKRKNFFVCAPKKCQSHFHTAYINDPNIEFDNNRKPKKEDLNFFVGLFQK